MNSFNEMFALARMFPLAVMHRMLVTQGILAEKFDISQSQVSRRMVKRRDIRKDAASQHRKLFKNGRKLEKYVGLYKKRWENFRTVRAKGHRVNFHWLWTRARVLYKEITASDESVIKSFAMVRFLRQHILECAPSTTT